MPSRQRSSPSSSLNHKLTQTVDKTLLLDPEEALYQLTKEKNPGLIFNVEAATLLAGQCWVSEPSEDESSKSKNENENENNRGSEIKYRVILRKITDTYIGCVPGEPEQTSIRASLVISALISNRVIQTKTRALGLYVNKSTELAHKRADLRISQCAKRLKLKQVSLP